MYEEGWKNPSRASIHYMELISSSEPVIGVSVSKPLSSHLNVDFICLSVCLSVMNWLLTINHFWLLFCAFASCVSWKTSREMKTWTMDSLTPRWRQQGRRPLRFTYSVARAIDITARQSVDAFCLCYLTHGACVKVTGLQPLLTTTRHRWLECSV